MTEVTLKADKKKICKPPHTTILYLHWSLLQMVGEGQSSAATFISIKERLSITASCPVRQSKNLGDTVNSWVTLRAVRWGPQKDAQQTHKHKDLYKTLNSSYPKLSTSTRPLANLIMFSVTTNVINSALKQAGLGDHIYCSHGSNQTCDNFKEGQTTQALRTFHPLLILHGFI